MKKQSSINSVLLLILTLLMIFCASCEKEETQVSMTFSMVPYEYFSSKAETKFCRNLNPVLAVMQTDKGVISFGISYVGKGWVSEPVIIEGDMYEVYDVSMYDQYGDKTHWVYNGNPPQNAGVVTRTWSKEEYENCFAPSCQYKYDFTKDSNMIWAVFCSYKTQDEFDDGFSVLAQ